MEDSPSPAERKPSPQVPFAVTGDIYDRLLIVAIFAGIAGFVWVSFLTGLFDPLLAFARKGDWGTLALRPTILWVTMGLVLLLLRTLLWLWYRPFESAEGAVVPPLTVIIPAYNEGAMVEQSIESVAAADYPRERLEIVVIDDGSKDDTWQYILRAAQRHQGLVTAIRLPENRGKRAALAEGFRRAKGEVLITIDSDSVIEPRSLRALAGPFRDPRVGAVAGKVAVYNRHHGVIPRMLHVRFILSFDFLRSTQSVFRTVYCCPGALAAYRAVVVHEVLDKWEKQRFLGTRCTYGEDRALTNYILQTDHDTVYQRTAVVHTVVPETYARLCKMYLRWDRSYIREELRFTRIVWTRPLAACLIALFDKTVTNLRYPVAYSSIGLMIAYAAQDPATVLRLLVAIGVAATFYTFYYLRSERSWHFIYGVLYAYFAFFALTWIFPFAAMTLRSRAWLTR